MSLGCGGESKRNFPVHSNYFSISLIPDYVIYNNKNSLLSLKDEHCTLLYPSITQVRLKINFKT
jgi:hypothetical protein